MKRGLVAVGAVLLLIGCSASAETPSPSDGSTPALSRSASASPAPSTSPSPSVTLTADEAAAEAALLGYFNALDLMKQDPTKATYESVLEWVTPIQAESVKNAFSQLVESGSKKVGFVTIRDIEWADVETIDGQKFVDVTFCQDASDTVSVQQGETIAPVYPTLSMSGQLLEERGGWKVVQLFTGNEVKPC